MKHCKVLIIESDGFQIKVYKSILAEIKFVDFIYTDSSTEALEILDNGGIDLTVLNLEMPEIDGFEIADTIRKNVHTRSLPIIFTTSQFTDKFFIEKADRYGAVDYIIKSDNYDRLISKIKLFKDFFERKEELNRTKNALSQYQDVLNTSMICYKLDIDKNIIEINELFSKTYRYDKDEVIGKNFLMLKDSNVSKDFISGMIKEIDNNRVWNGVSRNISKSGHKYIIKSMIIPILDEEGNLIHFLCLDQNITQIIDSLTKKPLKSKNVV